MTGLLPLLSGATFYILFALQLFNRIYVAAGLLSVSRFVIRIPAVEESDTSGTPRLLVCVCPRDNEGGAHN